MHKIEIRNKIIIFLYHRELINHMYNNVIGVQEEKFELRAELFYFHERRRGAVDAKIIQQSENEVQQLALAEKKSKKRKANKVTAIAELQDLIALADDLLQLLKQDKLLERLGSHDESTFPSYWEEISTEDFPRFNGVNATAAYQHYRFGKYSYLIPPHCEFFNSDVVELPKLLPQLMSNSEGFDLIVLDPPWRNKYIRRIKRVRQELGYRMLNTEQLRQMPIKQLVHERSIVAIWCTNSKDLQRAIVEELLPAWNLRLKHTLYWLKINTSGNLIGPIDSRGQKKQPFEMLYIACHFESPQDFGASLQKVTAIVSVPSVIHSHKPPLLPWLSDVLPTKPKCLEIFARYLNPQFTSIGLEVFKLMDERLYSSYGVNATPKLSSTADFV
ncbi:N(6)-adenine-specific methyltransferase METTL4 [Anastrepha ludens]|uniref:N(6)-adenine-specific methyltransferase METTL4 n=1 Tax=Anastrepha ludens TaxID=28586 RepID=UPI0023B02CDE|nr:N(6)-adenine-specific methyltransferase METTL4 [Anastrepha ludens]